MSNRQLVKLAFCVCLLPFFFSCSSERDEGSEGNGTLRVQVSADWRAAVPKRTANGSCWNVMREVKEMEHYVYKLVQMPKY